MKKLFVIAALCLTGMAAHAQQNLNWGQGPQVASPDVHADNSVTFNLIAPEAQKVQLTGDLRAYLDSKHHKYTYLETDGGHIWCNWRIYLSEFTPLLFK